MQELTHPWGEYARLQAISAKSPKTDSAGWGLEAEMNLFLDNPEAYTAAQGQRCQASAARLERSRDVSRRVHSVEFKTDAVDAVAQMEAREALDLIQKRVKPLQWKLLTGVAHGYEPGDIAKTRGISPGAVRTQLSRLRHDLAELRPAA